MKVKCGDRKNRKMKKKDIEPYKVIGFIMLIIILCHGVLCDMYINIWEIKAFGTAKVRLGRVFSPGI